MPQPARAQGLLERRFFGPLLGLLALLAPAVLATWAGLVLSGWLAAATTPLGQALRSAAGGVPWLLRELLVGDYGAATMLPLLFVWTLPIVLLHAAFTAVAKASGLLDRACTAVEPLVRPFRLTGRDVARVVMGYGCNVPAVVQGRGCLSCTRRSGSAAIAFGSACGYQLGAVLAVTSAAGHAELVPVYLLILLLGALTCARWMAGTSAPAGRLLVHRAPVVAPTIGDVWRELKGPLVQMISRVVPIFLGITLIASMLVALGVLDVLSAWLHPLLSILGLPAAVAPAVAAAVARKDGILLLAAPPVLATLSPGTLLAALVLASTVLPCAVTVLTLVREHRPRAAARILAHGTVISFAVTAAIAWIARLG
ncbi:MAG: hypothetical protein GEU98_04750 [Pseudonocardiaceae bacterium]|nr:hypothetical protein [Pseudonocardiaceae bacterium]